MGEDRKIGLYPLLLAIFAIPHQVFLGLVIGEMDTVRGFIQFVPGDKIYVGGYFNPFLGEIKISTIFCY
jgi:hypothetical protein